jgi:autotransporter-associated beta strand protein
MGADLSWQGLVATNNTGNWTISGANTLTLGTGGIQSVGSGAGYLVINAGVNQSSAATYDAGKIIWINGALSGSGKITKTGGSSLILNANNSGFSGGITHSVGVLSLGNANALGTGVLTLNGGKLNAYSTDQTIANDMVVTASSTLEAVNTNRDLTLTGVISGSAGLSTANAGTIILSGNNTFTGGIIASGETLVVGHSNALGIGALTANGSKLGTTANTVLTNNINIAAGLDVISSHVLSLNGVMSGAGNLTKSGNGNLLVTGNNAGFSGTITHSAGVISAGHNHALGTGVLTLNGGVLNAYTPGQTLANDIVLVGTTSKLEAVNTSRDLTLDGVISGDGAVTKIGTGALILNGANSFTNTTAVSAGKLVVNGNLASGLITVAGGARLGGTGAVQAATLLAGSTLEAGDNGPGTLTFNNAVTLDSGSTVVMEIAADDSYDILTGNGANPLAVGAEFTFDFTGNTTVGAGDTYTVLQNWGTMMDNGTLFSLDGLPEGLSVDTSRIFIDGSLAVIAADTNNASPPVGLLYVGVYRGANMAQGIYRFTDPAHPLDTAERIGSLTDLSTTYRHMGFDGSRYLMVNRDNGKLYENSGSESLFSLISGSYSYSEWHGIERCNNVYYGIYHGASSSMEGEGLYLFADPIAPENTCVKICTNQTFASNIWTDVAFDGERYLFVRSADAGGGIYQYSPDTDQFTLISGAETYADWEGLAVYDSNIAPLLNRKVYLLLFGGQSNALGWGYQQYLLDNNDPLQFPQDDVDMMYKSAGATVGVLPENTLVPLQSGNSNNNVKQTPTIDSEYPALTNAPISRFGPELSFARTVRDLIHIPDTKVAVVKYAVGGSTLWNPSNWHPDGTANRAADGPLYQTFQETAWRCVAALRNKYPYHEVEILGMGWVQGESDAIEGHGAEYQSNLTSFVTDVRATFGTNITFALSKVSPNQDSNPEWTVVRNAQQAVADTIPKVAATSTEGTNYLTSAGLSEGMWHFKTSSLLQIGRDLGNALMDTCGLDSDSDGIPDSWENSYPPGTGGLGNTPEADYDQDGQTDREEFLIGTSPVDPSDRLTVLMDTSLTGRWAAKKDVSYKVLKSTNLVSWTEIGSPVLMRTGNGTAEFNFSQHMQVADAKGFFKLIIE